MNYLNLAIENFEEEKYEIAIEYCNKLIEKEIHLETAYHIKAFSEYYLCEDEDDEIIKDALKNINLAIELNKNNVDLLYIKTCILKYMKQFENAIVEINKAIYLSNYNYNYYYIRGCLNVSLERELEAINDFNISLDIQENSRTYNARGELYKKINEYQLARQDFQKALTLDDRDEEIWENLGETLFELDLYELAISAFDSAIKLNPQNAYLYGRMSSVNYQLKRAEEALKCINKAIEIDPQNSYNYSKRGFIYLDYPPPKRKVTMLHDEFAMYKNSKPINRHLLLAKKDFEKSIELDTDNTYAYWGLHDVYVTKKNYKKVLKILKKLLILTPDDAKVYSHKGLTEMYLGYYENAITDFNKYLGFFPNSYEAYGNRGVCLTQLERYNEAMLDLNKTVELYPSALTYLNRGVAKSHLDDKKGAIKDYKTALKLNPNFPTAYRNLGIAFYSQKKYKKAINMYFKAYELFKEEKNFDSAKELVYEFEDALKGLLSQKEYKSVRNITMKMIKIGLFDDNIISLKNQAENELKISQ